MLSTKSRSSLLAAAALAMVASQPAQVMPLNLGYPLREKWHKLAKGGGNNRREDSAKRHAKAKAAYKSKRAQRKQAKR